MFKGNNSKINNMDNLRKILDNPNFSKKEISNSKYYNNYEDFNDLYEIEKPEFTDHKLIDVDAKPLDKKKMEIVDFQEIDRVYRRKKVGESPFDKIMMYKPVVIIEMWVFTIILSVVSISGLFLLRDWLFTNFGIYGDLIIRTPAETQNIHIWFGLAFGIAGLAHVIIHILSKNKDILPKQTLKDFKSFLHSGMYLIGFARRENYGVERFYARQRIVYTALVYILGLTFFTGFLQYINLFSDKLALVHVVPSGLGVMVLFFHLLITIRKHDSEALNCAFFSGKLPRWYIKKNHPLWYRDIANRTSNTDSVPQRLNTQINEILTSGDNLTKAILKFVLLINSCPDIIDLKVYITNLKSKLSSDTFKRIIELAQELQDDYSE